ncbi:MAG TPA: DUF3592 domain-containing protein [Lentimicrobium sp.]|nr:DUF3592 domain-containing protein [Lentimicrobium sp.]
MRFYISRPVFYLILILILLLPLSKKAGLLLFGERTEGTVTDYSLLKGNASSDRFPRPYNVSIITFDAGGKTFKGEGPLNVLYGLGETITVIYDKDDPKNNTLLTFSSLYSGYGLVLAGFVMMVWMAFYTTFGAKKQKAHRDIIKPGNRKLLE